MSTPPTSPVRIEGRLEPELSRWLWVVKWILAIPHYIVLAFLWIAFFVLTIVALFAILFTGRYPRGIFDFNLGVLRWTWRVGFYSYAALGTDRYPPFSLGPEPDYPATLEVEYPERLSRGLVLVKWWLLAIPQYIVVGFLVGGGGAAWNAGRWHWGWGWHWTFSTGGGLIGALVLFAGVALVFMNRYPLGIFDFVLGLDRWVARVAAYAGLMTDAYPPFRLDQGGDDTGTPSVPEAPVPAPAPADETAEGAAPLPGESPAPAAASGGGAGKVVLYILGSLAALLSLVFLAGGGVLTVVDQTQRDDDGFLMSPTEDFRTATYAIVSESADVDFGGSDRAADAFLGTVRIRSESVRPVFVGIASDTDVAGYLDGVEHSVVTKLDNPRYDDREGGAPASPPGDETFWVASTSGSGEQTLEWDPEEGSWSAVVMNEDGSRGVAAELSIGAELDQLLWIGIGMLVIGGLLAAGAALAITAAARRGKR